MQALGSPVGDETRDATIGKLVQRKRSDQKMAINMSAVTYLMTL